MRRRLEPEEADGHVWTDVIGIVLATAPDGLRLRPDAPRRGARAAHDGGSAQTTEVFVPARSIEAAKRLGPRPTPRGR